MIERQLGRGSRISQRGMEFELGSGRIAALHNGLPDDNPETVLLVPGFTGSKEDFTPLLRPLAAAGYRAVAIDQRGQYQSQWAESAAGYQLEALATDVVDLAGLLGGSVHLVGHSLGGLVGRLAVLQAPDRFADLVLLGSGPAAIQGGRRERLELGAQVLAARGMAALWQELQSQAHADPRYVRLAPVLNAFLRERFMATDPVGLKVMGQALTDEP
ncbi:MAG TPA: alpha/beta fold hydrolase, partial [Jatrophihabitans sp.]|nr:alpha/beta fold hydrolase [Jatrophihabitans sp.]